MFKKPRLRVYHEKNQHFGCGYCRRKRGVAERLHARQTLCVFDLLGTGGDVYAMMKDYSLAAAKSGADARLKALHRSAYCG